MVSMSQPALMLPVITGSAALPIDTDLSVCLSTVYKYSSFIANLAMEPPIPTGEEAADWAPPALASDINTSVRAGLHCMSSQLSVTVVSLRIQSTTTWLLLPPQ